MAKFLCFLVVLHFVSYHIHFFILICSHLGSSCLFGAWDSLLYVNLCKCIAFQNSWHGFSCNLDVQMALIARLQHPYIVEFKEAWVEKVRSLILFSSAELTIISFKLIVIILSHVNHTVGVLCLHCYRLLWGWRYVSLLITSHFLINLTSKLMFNGAYFDRAELMKKANGQYFPEEVCGLYITETC